ncbi:hypothetical protein TNCV_3949681 [Trichonephila clavipes]|nr:hypothetical protein TNCV_3949681 [Trichonephila clavipes]
MGCGLVINYCRLSTFPGNWYLFSTATYRWTKIAAGNFDAQFPPLRYLLHAVESNDMAAVDFLHHENPPTWAGVEPATLSAEGQRQTNHATQPAKINIAVNPNAVDKVLNTSTRR